jgi:hypothetical protein
MLSFFNPLRRQNHIFVACFPKSGSTYLCKALEALTGFRPGFVAEQGKHNDQDVSPRKLRRLRGSTVIQQHTKGTFNNVRILREFEIKPMINLRNLYDVVISLYDHLKTEDHRVPTGYVHREYWKLSYREQLDYIIHIHLPWYFNFLVSWHEASQEMPLFVSTYENLMQNRALVLRQIADFYSIDVADQAITRAIQTADGQFTRFNRGIVGRGRAELSTAQRESIGRLAQVWKLDATLWDQIGLGSNSAAAA